MGKGIAPELPLKLAERLGLYGNRVNVFEEYKIITDYEPFLGGGSVFFYLKSNGYLENKPVYLSDWYKWRMLLVLI